MWLGDGGRCSATGGDVLVLCPATWVGLVATAHSPQGPRVGGWLRGSDLGRPEGRCLGQVTREPGRAGNAVSLSGRRRHRCALRAPYCGLSPRKRENIPQSRTEGRRDRDGLGGACGCGQTPQDAALTPLVCPLSHGVPAPQLAACGAPDPRAWVGLGRGREEGSRVSLRAAGEGR